MDTAAQHTDMAEVYIKRWGPQEDFHDIPDHIIDALCEAFESEEERRQAVWSDDRHYREFFPLHADCRLRKACCGIRKTCARLRTLSGSGNATHIYLWYFLTAQGKKANGPVRHCQWYD